MNAPVRNIERDSTLWRPRILIARKGRDLGQQHDAHVFAHRNCVPVPGWPPRMRAILVETANMHGVRVKAILSLSRMNDVVIARQEVMGRLRETFLVSFAYIGKLLDRDHSTIQHGCRKYQERCQ